MRPVSASTRLPSSILMSASLLLMAGTLNACMDRPREPAKITGHRNATSSVSFTPEVYGPRLQQGAPAALRAKMHLGQPVMIGAIHDFGPTVNARGDALAVTAEYGGYRDEEAPCPAPWQSVIRWSGRDGGARLWQPKVAPNQFAATSLGFVLPADSCLPRGTTARDTTDWYVDSHGRIGQLRMTPGDPPKGVRTDAPGGPIELYFGTTTRRQTLLADRASDRIWSVPRPDVPSSTPPFVIAQDVTGRRWTVSSTDQGISFWWSDDRGATWIDASWAMHSDDFLYTDRTIGFVVGHSVTISIDRGKTWRTHRLPDTASLGLPRSATIGTTPEDVFPTSSGSLVLRYKLPGTIQRSALVHSLDPAWSNFTRTGSPPYGWQVTAKGDTLWSCDRFQSHSHGACSYSTDLGATWRHTHLPH